MKFIEDSCSCLTKSVQHRYCIKVRNFAQSCHNMQLQKQLYIAIMPGVTTEYEWKSFVDIPLMFLLYYWQLWAQHCTQPSIFCWGKLFFHYIEEHCLIPEELPDWACSYAWLFVYLMHTDKRVLSIYVRSHDGPMDWYNTTKLFYQWFKILLFQLKLSLQHQPHSWVLNHGLYPIISAFETMAGLYCLSLSPLTLISRAQFPWRASSSTIGVQVDEQQS